jgi:diadenylate cyclase
LASIFDNHSGGHDGAVIIERGDVLQFGCHLPLSLDTQKVGKLGLRHTAALGMSERTDALCLVVSEESGKISIARDSELKKVRSATELTGIIQRFHEDKFPLGVRKTHYTNWIRKNSLEKVIAVLLAAVLWYGFGYQRDSVQRDFLVPLEYLNIPKGWEIEESKTNEIQLTLMGSSQAFYLFDIKSLKASVDLSQIREGTQNIILSRDMIPIPKNLNLVSIKPESIRITGYKLKLIPIPLKVKTTGSLPGNLVMESIEVSPTLIKVLVPEKIDSSKLIMWTEPINLATVTRTLTLEPKLITPPDVRLKNGQAPAVKVTITVEDRPREQQR